VRLRRPLVEVASRHIDPGRTAISAGGLTAKGEGEPGSSRNAHFLGCPLVKTLTPIKREREESMANLVRPAIYALPAAGILTAVPWIFILRQPDAKTDPEGFARIATSAGSAVGSYLYIAGFVCLLFGLFALYGHLGRTRASRWATAGLFASVVVIALTLATIGALAVGARVLADAYLSGDKNVSSGLVLMSGESQRIMSSIELSTDLSVIGAIAFAVAVWRSGSLPKWAGVLLAPGIVLSMTLSPVVGWVGALLLVISGIWLARSFSHHQPAELAVSAEGSV